MRLLVESDRQAEDATQAMVVDDPDAQGVEFRPAPSIAGQRLRHTFGDATRLTHGASYEVRVEMSVHPATRNRPGGVSTRLGLALAAASGRGGTARAVGSSVWSPHRCLRRRPL